MTPQLDTVIIEVSSVKGGNPLRLYGAKHLNWTYMVTQDFTLASSYLNMKVLIFAEDENM